MRDNITLNLPLLDVGQILDALYQRLETWNYTAEYLRTGLPDERYWPEECSDPGEAHKIAQCYNEIIKSIRQQVYDCQ